MVTTHPILKLFTLGFKNYSKEEIKEIRAKMGMSQSEFGDLFFAEAGTVKGWESGRRTPECSTMRIMRIIEDIANERAENVNNAIRRAYA